MGSPHFLCDRTQIDEDSIFCSANENSSWEFFNFRSSGQVGVGLDLSRPGNRSGSSFVNPSNVSFTEMYFGLFAKITDGHLLTVRTYTHLDGVKLRGISIIPEHGSVSPEYTFENVRLNADLYDSSFCNGLYVINAAFRYEGCDYFCDLYMLVDCLSDTAEDCRFYICEGVENNAFNEGSIAGGCDRLREMLSSEGVTPHNSTDPDAAYPFEAEGSAEYDTKYWIERSSQIVKGYEDATMAFKATLIHDWMTSNLAFDRYKSEVLIHPRYAVGTDDGHYVIDTSKYVSATYAGVCRDFSEIYGIMCRAQGIPCVVCMSAQNAHAWNAVYINGVWTEIDVTHDIQRYVDTEDTTDVKNTDAFSLYCYDNYFTYKYTTDLDHLSVKLLKPQENE